MHLFHRIQSEQVKNTTVSIEENKLNNCSISQIFQMKKKKKKKKQIL